MCLRVQSAASSGNKTLLKNLVECAPFETLEQKDEEGKTPLILSVLYYQLECTKILVKTGVHIDNADVLGRTPLHYAALKGYYKFIKFLLYNGASVLNKDVLGITPLHIAAIDDFKCLPAVLKHLIPSEIDVQNIKNETPLHWCCAYSNLENLKLLLLKEANIGIPDLAGRTPLHWIAMTADAIALDCAKLLVEKDKSIINWQDYEGRSPLHLAVATGSREFVRFLASKDKFDIDVLDNAFCTPLHWASRRGFVEKMDVLLNQGASSLCADSNGATPIHYAALENQKEAVELFLSRNLNDSFDHNGRNVFMWAAANNAILVLTVIANSNLNIVKHKDKNGMSALHFAAIHDHFSALESLLDFGAVIDEKDDYGMTPFLRACQFGKINSAQSLISKGADIYAVDNYNCSALHWCTIGGHAYLLQILLLEADLKDIQDSFGFTALHYACISKGQLNCASILLECNANPNMIDKEGKTPLHCAIQNNHLVIIRLLCNYNADVNAIFYKEDWITPLDLAYAMELHDVIHFLSENKAVRIVTIRHFAASQIQIWYRHHKLIQHEKLLIKYYRNSRISPSIYCKKCFIKLIFRNKNFIQLNSSPNIFKNMVRPFNVVNTEKNKIKNVCANDFSVCVSAINISAKREHSALIVQRAWKKYLIGKRLTAMRKQVQQAHKSDEIRKIAENAWKIKLQSFYHSLPIYSIKDEKYVS